MNIDYKNGNNREKPQSDLGSNIKDKNPVKKEGMKCITEGKRDTPVGPVSQDYRESLFEGMQPFQILLKYLDRTENFLNCNYFRLAGII